MYYVEAKAKLNIPKSSILEQIRKPGNLEDFHPFCKSNKALKWPGEGAIDELIYLNGITYKRRFYNWTEDGYDLKIGGRRRETTVNWVVEGNKVQSSLRVRINPDFITKNKVLRWFLWHFYTKYLLKSYIDNVVRGFEYFMNTGRKVQSNQFGRHSWFS